MKTKPILIIVSFFVTFNASSASSGLLFDGSFSTSDTWVGQNYFNSAYGTGNNACLPRPNSLQVVTDPDNVMGLVAKVTLIDDDFCQSGVDRERARLTYHAANIGSNKEYDEVWVSWSLKLDNTWSDTTSPWYAFTSFSSPHFYVNGGRHGEFGISMGSSGVATRTIKYQFHAVHGPNPSNSYHEMFPLQLGEWYHFLMHVKFAKNNTGFYKFFSKTGNQPEYQLINEEYNRPTQMTIPNPNYPNPNYSDEGINFKQSIYRSAVSTSTSIVYYSGYKIGLNRSDVVSSTVIDVISASGFEALKK
ncbi:MAG: polysaccharide lyase [Xanthomonadales bacterium]|nr:polysaccharide lyase [Xanthomonadales bacterium]